MKIRSAVRLGLVVLALSTVAFAQKAKQNQVKQPPPIQLGTSGGNVKDISSMYCCSGTLGSLVKKGGTFYILSNNHILARSDQAGPNENISQPGLVDNGCSTTGLNLVAQFSEAPALGSNVDAAIAAVNSGMVATSGAILDIGVPSATAAAVDGTALGRGVAKAGRTTGLTCSTIQAIDVDLSVLYETECGMGDIRIISYTDQVLIGGRFSAGGDSGSLIVTLDTAQPIGLLFAGSSNTTIANPIDDVANALGGISFVGGDDHAVADCQKGGGKPPRPHGTPPGLQRALLAKAQHANRLMSDPAIQGVGVGVAEDNPDEAVVVIYVEAGRVHGPIPSQIDGVRTEVIRTDRFRAWGWNEPVGASCRASH